MFAKKTEEIGRFFQSVVQELGKITERIKRILPLVGEWLAAPRLLWLSFAGVRNAIL